MPKVSVSKAKSDVPASNHSNKSVAEPPNGEPDVNSQPKNDANELVVEKNEEGENCLFERGMSLYMGEGPHLMHVLARSVTLAVSF